MFYPNIHESHAEAKKEAIRSIFYQNNFDGFIVLGAQDRIDVHDIYDIAVARKIPCLLFDIRKTQLDSFPKNDYVATVVTDLSEVDNLENFLKICQILKGFKNPLIYDNLCGGKSRLKHIKVALKYYNNYVLFCHSRQNARQLIMDSFPHTKDYALSSYNSIIHIWKKSTEFDPALIMEPVRTYGRAKNGDGKNNPRNCNYLCPFCGARKVFVVRRTIKKPEFHCSKCKKEWDDSDISNDKKYDKKKKGHPCPKCHADSSCTYRRTKKKPEWHCCKCKHEWDE